MLPEQKEKLEKIVREMKDLRDDPDLRDYDDDFILIWEGELQVWIEELIHLLHPPKDVYAPPYERGLPDDIA